MSDPMSTPDPMLSMEEVPKIKKERPDSLTKKTPRASIFVEHHEMPHIWHRDSQSSYGGARSPSFTDNFETNSYMSSGQGHYGGFEPSELGKPPAIGYAYEMPDRYGGKGMAYSSDIAIPLTNNTWSPPVPQEKKWFGLGKTTLIVLCTLICVLVVSGVIGGIVAGVVISKQSIENSSSTSSTGVANPTSPTDISTSTSTMTLSNGSLVLTTLVITATPTAESQTTSQMQSQTQTDTQSESSAASTSTSMSPSTSATPSSTMSKTSASVLASPTENPASSPTNGTIIA